MNPLTQTPFFLHADALRHCPPGEMLFLEGDRCDRIGYVAEGQIVIRSSTPDGAEYLVQTVSPGQFFGDVMTFANEPRYLGNVVAETEVLVAFYSPRSFLKWLGQEEGLLEAYLRGLAQKTFELKQDVKLLAIPSLRERILFFLESERKKQDADSITLGMTRERWATKLGVCRPSLSRELSRMRKAGLIRIDGPRIERL